MSFKALAYSFLVFFFSFPQETEPSFPAIPIKFKGSVVFESSGSIGQIRITAFLASGWHIWYANTTLFPQPSFQLTKPKAHWGPNKSCYQIQKGWTRTPEAKQQIKSKLNFTFPKSQAASWVADWLGSTEQNCSTVVTESYPNHQGPTQPCQGILLISRQVTKCTGTALQFCLSVCIGNLLSFSLLRTLPPCEWLGRHTVAKSW